MSVVLDASAVLAVVYGEPGAEVVRSTLPGASMSVANYAEAIANMVDKARTNGPSVSALDKLQVIVRPMDLEQARRAGMLRGPTRSRGLSLGDRACLALALELGQPALTADRAWAGLDIGVPITFIR